MPPRVEQDLHAVLTELKVTSNPRVDIIILTGRVTGQRTSCPRQARNPF